MTQKKPLYSVPIPSTDFTQEAFLDCSGINPTIRYRYETKQGKCDAGIIFEKVVAFRKRNEFYCTAWHIEGAYDTLAEVMDSPWINELDRDVLAPHSVRSKLRHFMIYLDSVGCFEFLSEGWARLPERLTINS